VTETQIKAVMTSTLKPNVRLTATKITWQWQTNILHIQYWRKKQPDSLYVLQLLWLSTFNQNVCT